MSLALAACLLAVATALACALPGVFVVLKRESMVIDGIGHAVLPGIALGYLFTADIDSPVLLVTAASAGLAVALGTEWLGRSGLLAGDAPLGLIFPALFAAGVILISTRMSHVHLDVHAVLVGDLNLVALTHPGYALVMAIIAILNVTFCAVALPRLTTSTFDPAFAHSAGLRTRELHVAFMALVSLTATAAFQAAGAMLVIALMVIPACAARLLTTRVMSMLAAACGIGILGALGGFWLSYHLNAATSAGIAVTDAGLGVLAFLISRLRTTRFISHERAENLQHGQSVQAGIVD
ncbi:metal ABC transporter permease [Corynebacterium phoceense]|uniref:metal ABC transporter permease n=1 Tax=Corynebacterium phoceense TaxID=1686286 RepID=UPI00211B7FC0|nr:metal ABC transporter permease [Corynebacterium phoceense]MCQ9335246.1 metal ABC transporter permease [Corynebacterium phoceense]